MRHIVFLIWFSALATIVSAQNPVPTPAQEQPIAITGATAHLGNGEVIENALITFANGKLTQVSTFSEGVDLSGHNVIDASGKQIYPGFIAPNTQLGLVEINAVRSTNDTREVGAINPNVRALIAFNTDSQVIPTVRSRGVLFAQATPSGFGLAGTSSVMHLDGWNWEDAAVRADDGVHLYWPRRFSWSWATFSFSQPNSRFAEQMAQLQAFMEQAQAYCATDDHEESNLKLRAMCGVISGEQSLYVHVNLAKDIEQAVLLGREFDINVVVVGGRDSYLVTDLLRDNNVSVILGPTHDLPASADADIDQPFKTPAQLHEAGVDFAIAQDGAWQQRNLPFIAGTAVAYGLPYEEAIAALTLSTARILGVDDRIGSLEVGKDASFFICEGDVLDMRTSQVSQAFIDGRDINLDNKQNVLYRKFSEKYDRQDGE